MAISSTPSRLKGAISGFFFGVIMVASCTPFPLLFKRAIPGAADLDNKDYYITLAYIGAFIILTTSAFGAKYYESCNIFANPRERLAQDAAENQQTGSLNA